MDIEEPPPLIPPTLNIKVIGSTIYFYEHINEETIIKLKDIIINLNNGLSKKAQKYNFDPVIHLHIYSYGGDCFMGLNSYTFIKNNPIPIYTYIDGFIASSATFLFLGGIKKYINPTSMMLIHQLSTNFQGKFQELKDEFSNSSNIMDIIRNIYLENTNIKKRKLEDIINTESMLTSKEIMSYGLADELIK